MKFMLDHGATGLNILFDIPTIRMSYFALKQSIFHAHPLLV